jgi:hypothetical protein
VKGGRGFVWSRLALSRRVFEKNTATERRGYNRGTRVKICG